MQFLQSFSSKRRRYRSYSLKLLTIILVFLLLLPAVSFSGTLPSFNDQGRTLIPLGFNPTDTFLDPAQPVLYFTSTTDQKIYALNYETRELKSIAFDLVPEQIVYHNQELYVTLSSVSHKIALNQPLQGQIAIIDTTSFSLKDTLLIETDPYDVVIGHDGTIYVFSGSDQPILSYSRTTKQKISTSTFNKGYSLAEMHPIDNRIITLDFNYAQSLQYINVENGYFSPNQNATPIGRYLPDWNFKISPDGKFIFLSGGEVFGQDLEYVTKLNDQISDLAFDTAHNRFFTGVDGKIIETYSYNSGNADQAHPIKSTGFFNTVGDSVRLFYGNEKLISLSRLEENQYFLEIYSLPNGTLPATSPDYVLPAPVITSLSPQSDSLTSVMRIDFQPKDSLLDPDQPVVYLSDYAGKNLYAINYLTHETRTLHLEASPGALTFHKGELYVALSRVGQASSSSSPGAVAVVDPAALKLVDQIEVETIPTGVVVDHEGYVYVFNFSGYSDPVIAYSRVTKQKLSSSHQGTRTYYSVLHPTLNKIYSVNRDLYPNDLYIHDVNQGTILRYYGSPYHGDYPLNSFFRISPDARYLFNSSGHIYDMDLEHETKLNKPFADVAFDLTNNRFFAGENNRKIVIYDYNNLNLSGTFNALASFSTIGNVNRLFYQNEKLISISTMGENQYFLEVYAVAPQSSPATNPSLIPLDSGIHPAPVPINNPTVATQPLGFTPGHTLLDTNRPILYMVDSGTKSVHAYNYQTNQSSAITFTQQPERLALRNNELYVTLTNGHQYWTNQPLSGEIGIIDTQTFTLKDQFDIETDPSDVVVDHEGYIYVLPGSKQSQPILSYSPTTKQKIASSLATFSALSYAALDPLSNRFYMVNTAITPRDMGSVSVAQGALIQSFDSPYHGDYAMGTHFRISPDGKYIFNNSGEIFNRELQHVSRVSKFKDLAFDLANSRFFLGNEGNSRSITLYDYHNTSLDRSFYALGTFRTMGDVNQLFYQENKVIALTMKGGRPLLEVYTIPPGTIPLSHLEEERPPDRKYGAD